MPRESIFQSIITVTLLFAFSNAAWSQFLFREAFDSAGSGSNWGINTNDTDNSVIYGYNYLTNESIPEAPNTQPGDTATSGVILEANIAIPAAAVTVSLYPIGQSFTGNYQLRFDAWMNYDVDELVNGGAVGTTEFLGGGVGYDNMKVDVGSGAQAIVTGDGGSGSDWRAFKETATDAAFFVPAEDMAGGTRQSADPYYTDFLPGVAPPAGQAQVSFIPGTAGSPGFQWITWEFTAVNNVVDVTIEKPTGERLAIVTLDGDDTSDESTGFDTDGNISLFYADFFSSVSPRGDLTFGVIDNVEVTEVIATGLDGDYNEDDVVNIADYTLWRDNLGAPSGTLPNDPSNDVIGTLQYDTWKQQFGMVAGAGALSAATIPEPSGVALLLLGASAIFATRCRV